MKSGYPRYEIKDDVLVIGAKTKLEAFKKIKEKNPGWRINNWSTSVNPPANYRTYHFQLIRRKK